MKLLRSSSLLSLTWVLGFVAAQAEEVTEVTGCHFHGETLYCLDNGGSEWKVTTTIDSENPPESIDGCHAHSSSELYDDPPAR